MMKVSEILSDIKKEDLTRLLKKSNLQASWILLSNWLIIASCFLAIYLFPFIWVWILASFILAGRILGLAIIMHDCAHNNFFTTKWANQFFGKWFAAAFVMADLDRYRKYHLEHHASAGSDKDPDRPNYDQYPVSKKSFTRKVIRDLTGITAVKLLILIVKMNAGLVKYQLSYDGSKKNHEITLFESTKNVLINMHPNIIFHLIIALALGKYYFLFWSSWATFYMLFSRIRNATEHGATIDKNDLNPLLNTRTTLSNFLERLTIAPNYVNYHLEHHLLPSIPPYHLKEFHQLLSKNNVLQKSTIASSYREAISQLII